MEEATNGARYQPQVHTEENPFIDLGYKGEQFPDHITNDQPKEDQISKLLFEGEMGISISTWTKDQIEHILKTIDEYLTLYYPYVQLSNLNIFEDRSNEPYSLFPPRSLIQWTWCWENGGRERDPKGITTTYYWTHKGDHSLKRRAIEYNIGRSPIWEQVRLVFITESLK
eukprot:TRINITY_DN15865_c0_g1_i1.p1 TRINITY_DN15865_c0_g1~~TRINITY_DN15865_c0_g1_i1.p1  ORF type:complete len:185 (-),score=35.35 TRINITY_DN15865_c0_g1_i1:216-725(-)